MTDGHDEENSGDDLPGPLIQVYVPLIFKGNVNASGAFELYLPYAPVQAAIDNESHQLYVILAIGLALFYATMFPIVALADRWRRSAEATAVANVATQERLNSLKSQFLIRIPLARRPQPPIEQSRNVKRGVVPASIRKRSKTDSGRAGETHFWCSYNTRR